MLFLLLCVFRVCWICVVCGFSYCVAGSWVRMGLVLRLWFGCMRCVAVFWFVDGCYRCLWVVGLEVWLGLVCLSLPLCVFL